MTTKYIEFERAENSKLNKVEIFLTSFKNFRNFRGNR